MYKQFKAFKRISAVLVLLAYSSGPAFALPQTPEVVSGSAQIHVDQNIMTINASENAILNYSSFNINANESVIFNLPSADSRRF